MNELEKRQLKIMATWIGIKIALLIILRAAARRALRETENGSYAEFYRSSPQKDGR